MVSEVFPNQNILWADFLVEELLRQGVEYFCIAPGSRSSPLITPIVSRAGKIQTFVHYDERALAFHALGYGRATQKPAAVITTSGTAAANLYPAIIEASAEEIPLIVITADRPPELLDAKANQAIDQIKLYGTYPRLFSQVPCPDSQAPLEFVLTTAAQAYSTSTGPHSGPVHINFQFREPLAPTANLNCSVPSHLESYRKSGRPYSSYSKTDLRASPPEMKSFAAFLNQSEKGVIVVGQLKNIDESKAVQTLIDKMKWPVLADAMAGLPFTLYGDLILMSCKTRKNLKPDAVLRLGGRLTSQRIQTFLNESKAQTLTVQSYSGRQNPFHQPGMFVHCDLRGFCDEITSDLNPIKNMNWLNRWTESSRACHDTLKSYFNSENGLTEPGVAESVSKHLPKSAALFCASSMPIRDLNLFGKWQDLTRVSSNRGASGIDGTIATASGFACGLKKPVTLLIGDLALLHDLNSLSALKDLTYPVIVVVVNNDGGGIFSFLPISKIEAEAFEKFWATPHQLTFQKAAEQFNLSYRSPKTKKEFIQNYTESAQSKFPTLIEINTHRSENFKLHKTIEEQMEAL
jgi:2-succinyl-5-enolpyruvyl-6-hydroxy-3-cyclohexene-1-carboxylate synthase